ncbi:Long chain base biosynthesis protein 2a [Sarracenia purpurea var. burkii]
MITIPYLTALTTYFSYGLLFVFGQLRDFFRNNIDWWKASNLQGYAPICLGFEDFYIKRLCMRVQVNLSNTNNYMTCDLTDYILIKTTKTSKCLNLGSYNYLGFAAVAVYCTPCVIESLKRFSPSTCSSRVDGGTTIIHTELEEIVAKFVGKPTAIVSITRGVQYSSAAANSSDLQGGLIISDSLIHNSIVNGARGSGATIRVFQHNTPSHLEKVLREQIADGQPRTHRPWKKIMVVVEGIYSMEGEICKFSEILAICKKYKAYVYLDEAHSIGAVGKTGRGSL